MAFRDDVPTQNIDFPAQERAVLKFWDARNIFEKRKALNAGKQPWSFLDGPITANNPMGVHHAWGRTYKDAFNRYYSMMGRELRYQQGFDCQGLWVEVEVEKSLGLKSKRDIENLVPGDKDASIAMFVDACKKRVDEYARIQTNQSIRLGYWMNWDRTDEDWAKSADERHSYFTMATSNNTAIWAYLKKCHDDKLIYRDYDVMPWCGRCGVGISEMELKEGYRLVEHRAVFVKFKLLDAENEYLIAWTTTPWTLPSNVAAAVNPKLNYLKVRFGDEVYYIGAGAYKLNRMEASSGGTFGGGDVEDDHADATGKKATRPWLKAVPPLSSIEQILKSRAGKGGTPPEVVGQITGAGLVGRRYAAPFDDLPAQNSPSGFPEEVAKIVAERGWAAPVSGSQAHRVIAWDDVSESEGTGIVHIAPGCGREDFHLGQTNQLPALAPLDEAGRFVPGYGPMAGLAAHEHATADVVFEELKSRGRLLAIERYVHRYPHCWRCKTELLYRLVDEWFINMGPRNTEAGYRGEIMRVAEQVTFLPQSLNGRARERDWLWNMGDWMISKKRYWGLCLPIWVDENDPTDFDVIGSLEELKSRAVEGYDEFAGHTPHRPWIDKVVLRNPRTGNKMRRIADVGNPWLDAGIVAFSTLNYHTDPGYWRKWYPAEFITESFPGQFRNWFYSLLALSTKMAGEPPFRNLLGFATVKDQYGADMHKSDGNSIEFNVAADGDENGVLTINQVVRVDTSAKPPRPVTEPVHHAPIGADVMRWLYCRHNPAHNLNFGPAPADEVRARFVLKLWNCYALLANYARLDGFDPSASAVPLARRPAIDRWVLSNLNRLVATANAAFQNYQLDQFALAAEEFADAQLSNWYIRTNRDRFWRQNSQLADAELEDKLAAYQTLYTVVKTFAQLLAPCVPFLAETMWQNLRADSDPESVHLCNYPQPDPSLDDPALSETMDAVLRLVTLGNAARNSARQPVRQVLAELVVAPGSDAERLALQQFAELIRDELNVKAVTLHPGPGPLLSESARVNRRTAAGKLGQHLRAAEAELAAMPGQQLADALAAGTLALAGVELAPADLIREFAAPPGYTGAADRKTQLALDARLTPELRAEGRARTVVRLVQNARKTAGLSASDRIALELECGGELAGAVAAHRAMICEAVQAVRFGEVLGVAAFEAPASVEEMPLTIRLAKVESAG